MSTTKPILLGYQYLREETSPDAVENDRRVMRAFGEREGFALDVVYTDYRGERRALDRLLTEVRSGACSAVVVPSDADFGVVPSARRYVRALLARADVRLLVAEGFVSEQGDGAEDRVAPAHPARVDRQRRAAQSRAGRRDARRAVAAW